MKVKGKVGKNGTIASPGRCLRIGGAVMTLKCGLAYAGNSIVKGDASGIGKGLDTVAKSAMEIEGLMPEAQELVGSIKAGMLGLTKELKPGRRISMKVAGAMLAKVRELGVKVDQLYSRGVKGCV